MSGLPVELAWQLASCPPERRWLIDELWAAEAVGIVGGEPKCCKSFLALDMAVAVAAGVPCLRRFPVTQPGRVLLYAAEDALHVVRQRLDGIARAAGVALEGLDIHVITAASVRLDLADDQRRLADTAAALRPRLLVLDPFVRLHRRDENVAAEVAPLLAYLRELQRQLALAVVLVHHARKGGGKLRAGQALRGSSELHAWGDSNLYLRRSSAHLTLSVEHRAAPSPNDIALELADDGQSLALSILDTLPTCTPQPVAFPERVLQAMSQALGPLTAQQLRKLCRMRTTTLCETLTALRSQGRVIHTPDGYALSGPQHEIPVSLPAAPIGDAGNGNGKRPVQLPLLSGETQAGSAGTQPAQG
jgi:hypothetical protein